MLGSSYLIGLKVAAVWQQVENFACPPARLATVTLYSLVEVFCTDFVGSSSNESGYILHFGGNEVQQ